MQQDGEKVNDSVFQLELYCLGEKGQGNGEWVLELERKIFHSLETEQPTRKQSAEPCWSLPWSGWGFEEWVARGLQQEE